MAKGVPPVAGAPAGWLEYIHTQAWESSVLPTFRKPAGTKSIAEASRSSKAKQADPDWDIRAYMEWVMHRAPQRPFTRYNSAGAIEGESQPPSRLSKLF